MRDGMQAPGTIVPESSNAEIRRLRAVLDAASDAYFCADASGVVLDCNRAAEDLFGLPRQVLLSAGLRELVVPAELQDRARREQTFAEGGWREPVEVTVVRPDDVEMRLEVSVWQTENDDGEPLLHALCRDVTERARLHEEMTEQARRLSEAQSMAQLGSWEWELASDVVVWSVELYRVFGIDADTPVTLSTFLDRVHPEDLEWVQAEIDAAALSLAPLHYEARILRTDGEVRWIAAHGDATASADGVPVRLSGTAQDITTRKVAELELERLTVTDALTGLANRSLLDRRLETALADGRRNEEPVPLLLIDLDGFKPVNDTHGHPAGDAVLVELAGRLSECIRPSDTLARIGGDEFAILLPGADRADATRIARRLVEAVSKPVVIDEATTVTVGASVGIAGCGTPPRGDGELRRQADQALYAAKRSGRGRHVVFTPELTTTGNESVTVRPRDARAWADYMQALRAEIAACKDTGVLPETSRAPASVLRTLEVLLAAIGHLPDQQEEAELPLPERVQFEEFVFHQSMVHDWADALVQRDLLTTERPARASAFWTRLREEATTTS